MRALVAGGLGARGRRPRALGLAVAPSLALALAACGGGDGKPARPYLLAATGVQADPTPGAPDFFAMRPADLAADADVVSVHQDFYGVPWDAFAAGVAPPAAWVAKMDALRAEYAGRRIFLSLQLAGGPERASLADRARADAGGAIHVDGSWSARCYDFATATDGAALRQAWARYVAWMVARFDPEWVNVGVELNLFAVACPSAWPGMVATERAGYDAAKAAKPGVVAFPSIQLDTLYGRQSCPGGLGTCYDANFAQLAGLATDRFAVSLYPQGDPEWLHPADVPADYLTRAADRAGLPLLVAETGWDSAPVRATYGDTCATWKSFTEDDTDAWLAKVLDVAEARRVELVTWWSDRDFLPAAVSGSCTFDATWQPVVDVFRAAGGADAAHQYVGELALKLFGTMGVRQSDGTPKAAPYARWRAARERPVSR